jgi:hypothetical protein
MHEASEINYKTSRFFKKYLTPILAVIIFIGLFVFFSTYAAGPKGSDELLYADIGLRGYGNYIVMNRYTHIYLEAIFMALAPTPLIGMKIFWGFVASVSAVSVFLLGRYLRKDSNIWHGVIAMLIFLAGNIFDDHFGIPIVDLTATMMVMIYLLVFVYFIRKNDAKWVIILLGAIFFWAFKTKEFAVILLLTLPVLGFDEDNAFSWKKVLASLGYFLLGVLAAAAAFILVNTIVLGDPLFGIKLSDWIQFRATIASISSIRPDPESYLQELIWPVYFLSFTLYLLSFAKLQSKLSIREKVIWLMPLVYLVMMILLMVKSGWRVDGRYLYPVVGLIATLATQFFKFNLPHGKKATIIYFIELLVGVAIIFLVRFLLYRISASLGMTITDLVMNYAVDLFFLALLLAALTTPERTSLTSILMIVLIGLNVFFSLSMNLKGALRGDIRNRVNNRFAALALPRDILDLCPETSVEISSGLLDEMSIHPDPYEAAGVINVFLDTRLPIESFSFMAEDEPIEISLSQASADYLMMTSGEWDVMMEANPNLSFEQYQLVQEENDWVVIMENRGRTSCQSEP